MAVFFKAFFTICCAYACTFSCVFARQATDSRVTEKKLDIVQLRGSKDQFNPQNQYISTARGAAEDVEKGPNQLTLVEWTARCFSSYDERFDRPTFRGVPVLSAFDFHQAVDCFIKKFRNKPSYESWVDLEFLASGRSHDYKLPYVEKFDVMDGSIAAFVGDIHGSLHSLLRSLWRLVALGYLDKNFSIIKKNFYLIFLGDYVDRGRYGAEVLYTLLRLKCASWDNVVMIRGNHEVKHMNENPADYGGGFWQELALKYGDQAQQLFDEVADLYQCLPLAAYVVNGTQSIMAAHGGLGPYAYYYEDRMRQFLAAKNKRYWLLSLVGNDADSPAFQWCDFVQKAPISLQNKFVPDRHRVWRIDQNTLMDALQKAGLKALFRGHQHGSFGLKMLFKESDLDSVSNLQSSLDSSSLYHWRKVVQQKNPQALEDNNKDGFEIGEYLPLFTCSSAPEGVLEKYDCVVFLFMSGQYAKGRLKVLEFDSPLVAAMKNKTFDESIFTVIQPKNENGLRSSTGMKDVVAVRYEAVPETESILAENLKKICEDALLNK